MSDVKRFVMTIVVDVDPERYDDTTEFEGIEALEVSVLAQVSDLSEGFEYHLQEVPITGYQRDLLPSGDE